MELPPITSNKYRSLRQYRKNLRIITITNTHLPKLNKLNHIPAND